MSFHSPRTKKIVALREQVLKYDAKIRSLGIHIVEELGCSTQGCAYRTSDGRAAKITTDWDEIRLGQWLYMAQKDGLSSPALPRIDLVRMLEPGLFLIVREELDDLEFDHPFWFDDVLSESVYQLYSGFTNEVLDGTPYRIAFDGFAMAVNMLFEDVITKANDAEYEDVWADDIDKAEEIWRAIQWLLDNRILICDIISDNWGVREDGTIVVRDLGCNTAPILDASLFMPYRPNPDDHLRELLRAWQAAPHDRSVRSRYFAERLRAGQSIGHLAGDEDIKELRELINSLTFLRIEDADVQSIFVESPGLYVAGLDEYAEGAIRMKYKLKSIPTTWRGMRLPLAGINKKYDLRFTVCIVYLDNRAPLVSIDVEKPWRKAAGYKRVYRILKEELEKYYKENTFYHITNTSRVDELLVWGHARDVRRVMSLTPNEERLIQGLLNNKSPEDIIADIRAPKGKNWPRLSGSMQRMRYTNREDVLVNRVYNEILRQSPRIFDGKPVI